jgi:hypothetical protein
MQALSVFGLCPKRALRLRDRAMSVMLHSRVSAKTSQPNPCVGNRKPVITLRLSAGAVSQTLPRVWEHAEALSLAFETIDSPGATEGPPHERGVHEVIGTDRRRSHSY